MSESLQPQDEFSVMRQMSELADQLDDETRGRVTRWYIDKYGPKGALNSSVIPDSLGNKTGSSEFGSFVDLFDAAQPESRSQMVLLAAYWTQFCDGNETFASQAINDQLKDMGHKVPNITNAIDRLVQSQPALMRQVKKSGTTKQARKLFKVTEAGRRAVLALLEQGVPKNG